MHPELAPVAFIAAFSLFLALPWHWRARNVATLSIIAWLFVSNIIFAVDAVIWADNVRIVGVAWCDITVKLMIGGNFALPAACLCICIHLEQVSSVRIARVTARDKKRRQIFEACMCFGLPVFFMAIHYIVQGHRFDILQDYGCRPSTYFSIPSIFMVWIPPMLMATASLVYAALALRHFVLRRITFAAHLSANHSALTTSRYMRLILMSILQMTWTLGLTIFTLWFTTVSIPLRPYDSWVDVHSNFSRIDQYPNLFTAEVILTSRYALWWMTPASTFLFVAFFAFGNEATEEYKKLFRWIRVNIFRFRPSSTSTQQGKNIAAPPKFQGGISLASFDSKPLPSPPPSGLNAPPLPPHHNAYAYPYPVPAPKYSEHEPGTDNDTDVYSIASTSSVGPALSYQRHPADSVRGADDDDRDDDGLDDLPDTPSTLGRAPEPDTPSAYSMHSSTTTSTRPVVPPGDLHTHTRASPPFARNLTGDAASMARPYTYPSLDASYRELEFPIGQAV
ncbi:pheromone B beta 1 receptor [Favolaschia claudopus]|uniref:Pheromone B beta 1 receptor n=1 Tax=Favolaschia claudopus TaxID=2862362 RepID=A0AAV9ZX68_9AGAR